MALDPFTIKALLAQAIARRTDALTEDKSCCMEYERMCILHAIVPPDNRPGAIPEYFAKAARLKAGLWAGFILASVVFGILNAMSLNGDPIIVFSISVVAAILLGCVGGGVIARFAEVNAEDPQSTTRADHLLLIGGTTALASFAIFAYLRFAESENARSMLAAISMAFEIGTLTFAAAARELLPVYSWPERLASRHDRLQDHLHYLNRKINACETQLNKEHDDDKNDDDSMPPPSLSGGVPLDRPPRGSTSRPNGAAASASVLK